MNNEKMKTIDDLYDIKDTAHFWNWAPDLHVVIEIYESRDDAYSILLPFMFTYLEELIRSTTSEYGMLDPRNSTNRRKKVGKQLIRLAIKENFSNLNLVKVLEKIADKHYGGFNPFEYGENRNNVGHGVVHPKAWSEENFQSVVRDVAELAPYAGF